MAYDSKRAAIGQATNLAVHDAIKNNMGTDTGYINRRFKFYLELGEIFQYSDTLSNEEVDKLLAKLERTLK